MIDEKAARNVIPGNAFPAPGVITQQERAGQGRVQQAILDEAASLEVQILPPDSEMEHGEHRQGQRFYLTLPNGERVGKLFTYGEIVDSHTTLSAEVRMKVRQLVSEYRLELTQAKRHD